VKSHENWSTFVEVLARQSWPGTFDKPCSCETDRSEKLTFLFDCSNPQRNFSSVCVSLELFFCYYKHACTQISNALYLFNSSIYGYVCLLVSETAQSYITLSISSWLHVSRLRSRRVSEHSTPHTVRYWLCGRVPDLQSGGCRVSACATSHQGLYSASHPSRVGKWVPVIAGKAKAGMAHSDCGWTCGSAGCETVKSLENTRHTCALLRWWFTTKRRYIKCMYLYLYTHSSAPKSGRIVRLWQ